MPQKWHKGGEKRDEPQHVASIALFLNLFLVVQSWERKNPMSGHGNTTANFTLVTAHREIDGYFYA